jgi:hypothetical protein
MNHEVFGFATEVPVNCFKCRHTTAAGFFGRVCFLAMPCLTGEATTARAHFLLPSTVRQLPAGKYYKWLSYGNTDKTRFVNREFSFTLKDDVYIRYRSYANEAEMTEGA